VTDAPLVLGIETSCDETAVAVVRGGELLCSEIASQMELHRAYGGVVPEVASRNHVTQLRPLLDAAIQRAGIALDEVDVFAATSGPGLATSLMVGLAAAKGLAIGCGKPFLAVNHLEGHLLSPFFGRAGGVQQCLALIVSGGHTLLVHVKDVGDYHVVGRTLDDAAGEAFDKVAKLLGLPYPGGPEIDRLAREGDAARFDFPRSMRAGGNLDFSFSGLKTAVRYTLPKISTADLADVCASFQEAVVDVLVEKTIAASRQTGCELIAVSGGVSCNSRLRAKFQAAAARAHRTLLVAEPRFSTDNAVMIAFAGALRFQNGETSPLGADIDPNQKLA
jgi:N6-L-threonylcarbamoyladenine synthase